MSSLENLALQSNDILIVDDVLENIKLLSEILSVAGFSVRKAINGPMALMAIKASLPYILLLDISMPEMDGFEVCKYMKASPNTKEIPIIFLSALDDIDSKIKAFNSGAADYITKPFYQEEVLKRVQNQVQIRQLTQALTIQNKTLENALQYLKNNQAEIIQREKMSGLNQLISGVAHEVNNPVNFIIGNLGHASDYFQTLHQAITSHGSSESVPQPDHSELAFVLEDFPKLLKSMQAGAQRINDIVQALQTFSHHGEEGLKAIALHQTLDSVLILLQPQLREHKTRPEIVVDRQYGSLPPITCDVKLIGQVFLNVLNNAIEAIDALWQLEHPSQEPEVEALPAPRIIVTTQVIDDQWVEIAIADNGIGIAEKYKSRIFDPFFSTKPVGAGKGLGLTMSYRVITEEHRGSLTFEPAVSGGTQFSIRLPLTNE